jgi:lipoprotein NlpI
MQGDLVGAMSDFDQAIALNPDLFEAYFHRGVERLTQGMMIAAQQDFDQCLKLNPEARSLIERQIERLKFGGLLPDSLSLRQFFLR